MALEQQQFNKLISRGRVQDGHNVGGRFSLPTEFDTKTLASAFYPDEEAPAYSQEQPVQGTVFNAPGWEVWKYPDFLPGTKTKHPKAGKTHKVSTKSRDGETFVLMSRDKTVQYQVNEVFGYLSRERMAQEIESSLSVTSQDSSMLSNEQLTRQLGREVEAEEPGRGPVAPVLHGGSTHIRKVAVSVTQ